MEDLTWHKSKNIISELKTENSRFDTAEENLSALAITVIESLQNEAQREKTKTKKLTLN